MFELIVAGLVLALCAAMLLRMALPEGLRRRIDARLRGARTSAMAFSRRIRFWRQHKRQAEREAEEAIRRASRKAERDGNVYRPDAMKRPRNPH
jgi:hypothetical protein